MLEGTVRYFLRESKWYKKTYVEEIDPENENNKILKAQVEEVAYYDVPKHKKGTLSIDVLKSLAVFAQEKGLTPEEILGFTSALNSWLVTNPVVTALARGSYVFDHFTVALLKGLIAEDTKEPDPKLDPALGLLLLELIETLEKGLVNA